MEEESEKRQIVVNRRMDCRGTVPDDMDGQIDGMRETVVLCQYRLLKTVIVTHPYLETAW